MKGPQSFSSRFVQGLSPWLGNPFAVAAVSPCVLSTSSASNSSKGQLPESTGITQDDAVLFEEKHGLCVAILNRPKALNSLNTHMVKRLRELYEVWEVQPAVKAILIKGNGRAFCAGGDVRSVYSAGMAGDVTAAWDFFALEYKLNYLIATLRKPHVAFLDGVVMGGGNGISMHGTFRIATEKTLFAMPETAIGLHPDVGASYFLSRLPGHIGEYLATTGARLNGSELLHLGLATHFVPSEDLPALEERLCHLGDDVHRDIQTAIAEFAKPSPLPAGSALRRRDIIDRWFGQPSAEAILDAGLRNSVLLQETLRMDDREWIETTTETLQRMSPTAIKVSLRSIREARQQTLHEALIREYRLSARALGAVTSQDFYEGVRALLIDKDNAPKWNPSRLEDVSDEMVARHFAPFDSPDQELQLPQRDRPGPGNGPRLRSRL